MCSSDANHPRLRAAVSSRTEIHSNGSQIAPLPWYMELSAETDRLRIEFLRAELELSSTFVQIATAEFEGGNREHGQQSLLDARKSCETVTRFLADPKHSGHMTESQFQDLHKKLGDLEKNIASLSGESRR